MIEAFIPPLPLFAIVAGNAAAFGLWWGFLFSWIGTFLGSALVFLLFRTISKGKIKAYLMKYDKVERFFHWVEKKGFTPIFILYSFPFTPSFLVNVTAGLATIPLHTFLLSLALGKGVMVFIMSFVGHDILEAFAHPWKLVTAIGIIIALWYVGKRVERHYIETRMPEGELE